MSYTIRHRNGEKLVVLSDQEVNGDYSVTLTGRKVNSYGEIQQDNFIWLTENFASNSEPTNPLRGQLWYDTVNACLKVCSDTASKTWKKIMQNNITMPSNPDIGDIWFNDGKLKVFDGTEWIIIGPSFNANQIFLDQTFTTTNTTTSAYSTLGISNGITDGDVFTFTVTITAKSSSDPLNFCGQWIFKGLGACKISDTETKIITISKVDVESRLSNSAITKGWKAEHDDSVSNSIRFILTAVPNSSESVVNWDVSTELIMNRK